MSRYLLFCVYFILIALFFLYRNYIGIDLPWNADLSVLAMGFVVLGIWYHLCIDDFISLKCRSFLMVFIMVIVHFIITLIAFMTTESSVDWYSNRFGNPIFFIIGSCTGIFATVLVSKKLHLQLLTFIGANSIVWYGLHRIVIDMTFVLYNKLHVLIIRGSLLSAILAVVSVVFTIFILIPVNFVLTKYFPFFVGRKRVRDD